jgi:hypothetical protein
VLDFLKAWSAAPGWLLEGSARGRAVAALTEGVYGLLNKACLDNAQPFAAHKVANRLCDVFVDRFKMVGGTLNCGSSSCGKSTMYEAVCKLFGATKTEACVFIKAKDLKGAFICFGFGVVVRLCFEKTATFTSHCRPKTKPQVAPKKRILMS